MTREEKKEYDRLRYIRQRKKIDAQKAAWRKANPDKVRAACALATKRWRKANPASARRTDRIQARRRRAGLRNGIVSSNIEEILFEKQDGYCAYNLFCNSDLYIEGFHLDHIMPLALGGLHEDSNLQLTCPICNLRKSAKHPDDFLRSL